MIHGDFAQYNEDQTGDPFHLENKKLLKVSLQYGPVMAKAGSMVAYQGEAAFKNLGSGGLSKMIKKAVTAEGVVAMEVTGNGQVFLANQGMDIQVMYLENDAVFCNGASVLAYSASIEMDIERVGTGGGGMRMMAGAMAGLAGAYLSTVYTPLWVQNMSAGRGWIAVALVVFAAWKPGRLLLGAYLFGAVTILQFHAQGLGIALPVQLLAALPYLATIVVLVLISRDRRLLQLNLPASLGKPYLP